MSDDAPMLGLNGSEWWQIAQAINTAGPLAVRLVVRILRAGRERDGRLAYSDDKHAELQHQVRQHPPVRLMSETEQDEWRRRVPSELAAQSGDEPISVWSARIADPQGKPTGEWGLEARTWDQRGGPTAAVMVVCRDAEDALAMSRHLREHGSPESLGRLHALAAHGHGQFVQPPEPAQEPGTALRLGGRAPALVLSEHAWETALRRELSPELADMIIVKDPAHPHHAAWRELHELANMEMVRVGADPARLAERIRTKPQWHRGSFDPPALAHWALKEWRTEPGYRDAVAPPRPATPPDTGTADPRPAETAAAAGDKATKARPARPPRLTEVRSPQDAVAWANSLNPRDPEHRLEANQGFGHWSDQVDTILNSKYPGLARKAVEAAKKAAKNERATPTPAAAPTTAEQTVTVVEGEVVEPAPKPDQATLRGYADRVNQLDTANKGHQMEAHIMVGHTAPEIDRLIAEKFADNPKIVEKVHALYPDGLPKADEAAWRNRAQGEDAAAAAEAAVPDDPRTPRREDVDAAAASQGERGVAATQRGIANTVVGTQPAVLRRTAHQEYVPGPVRRT